MRSSLPARKSVVRRAAAAVAVVAASGAAFFSPAIAQTTASTPTTTVAPTTTVPDPKLPALTIRNTRLGDIIADQAGMSLYMFVPDVKSGNSTCEGPCLAAWPALFVPPGKTLQDIKIAAPLRRSKLGVAMRADGSRQVTYEGWPLYYWVRDNKAGDVNGQWVGNVWFVVDQYGNVVTTK